MARKYDIGATASSVFSGITSALADFYPGAHTIHFQDAANIVFSVPGVFDRVIKITINATSLYAYYGTSRTSGSTIANQVTVQNGLGRALNATVYLILAVDFLLIAVAPQGGYSNCIIFGKLDDGRFGCISTTVGPYSSSADVSYGYLSNDGSRLYTHPLVFPRLSTTSPSGKLLEWPLFFLDSNLKIVTDTVTNAPCKIAELNLSNYEQNIFDSDTVFNFYGSWRYNSVDNTGKQWAGSFLINIDNHTL